MQQPEDERPTKVTPVVDLRAKVDAAALSERLSKLNRAQRRGIIARARKQARAAKKEGAK